MIPAQDDPASGVPRHIAIVMDGNGRWAERRGMPRTAGHRAGTRAVRAVIEQCARRGVGALTLFAFSSENWSRPAEEVGVLMQLFIDALQRQVRELAENGVRLRFIGERSRLSDRLRSAMDGAEQRTAGNTRLDLFVAVSYGGRWDIVQAARALAAEARAGRLDPADIDEDHLAAQLALAGVADPDLFIRTGGEHRVSNFLLWNLAYTELYFTDTLWPDFDAAALDQAIEQFTRRERRFGLTPGQLRSGG